MNILDDVHRLADLIDLAQVPAPHGIHLNYPHTDRAWVRALGADAALIGKVGLRHTSTVDEYRTLSGLTGTEVRVSWLADDTNPDRAQVVAALHVLADLAAAGEMPTPERVDAMHAVPGAGRQAVAVVEAAAVALDVRPTVIQDSAFASAWVGRSVSYTVHAWRW